MLLFRQIKGLILLGAISLLLIACSASDETETDSALVSSLDVVVESPTTNTNSSPLFVRALVKDASGQPLPGVRVEFKTDLGQVSAVSVKTNEFGVADVEFSSSVAGEATITISAGFKIAQSTITVKTTNASSSNPAYLSIATSQASVTTNNKDTAVLTATVLDADRGVIPGVTVNFSASAGQLSIVNAITDENGVATSNFTSGDISPNNQVATITVSTSSLVRQIPVQIVGTTITISSDSNFLLLGGPPGSDQQTLTITAKDGGSRPLYNQTIDLSIAGFGGTPGWVSLSASTVTTDINGLATVTLTSISSGDLRLTATGMGASANKDYEIQAQTQAFYISNPSSATTAVNIGDNVIITVQAPNQTSVTFSTSLGTVDSGGGPSNSVVATVVANVATTTLTSNAGGVATVDVLDTNDPNTRDSILISFAAPAASADSVEVQSDRKVVSLSNGSVSYKANVTATVVNSNGFPVQNAPVWFSLSNSTGGGETINPSYVLTGTDGKAGSVFTSGTHSSSQAGVSVTATIANAANDTVEIVIGGTAGSLAIGSSTKIQSINNDTTYKLPMSVLVADSNGNPMAGTTVSLSSWPAGYYTGYWYDILSTPDLVAIDDVKCIQIRTSGIRTNLGVDEATPLIITNEDANKNLILDPGEDDNLDGTLTPESSSAGTLPQTVITDANGVASFDLVYLKQYAGWVLAQISATTIVVGTETTSNLELKLPFTVNDGEDCVLPISPFGEDDEWRFPNT